jgi:hypothetical protein
MTLHPATQRTAHRQRGWGALLLGLGIFGLLWVIYIPYRGSYLPNRFDIPVLADGLLLAPGARWQDWFTRGYSHFWDPYPEWPQGLTGFTRPAFQFMIYLLHFVFGRDWASYQVIDYFATAGMGAVAFYIAQTVLGLRARTSLLVTALVVVSPPVVQSLWSGLAFAVEPIATLLVAGAFLAAVGRRDFLCLILLVLALLMKENTVWAPLAAAITIMLRSKLHEPVHRRAFAAAAMFFPIAMWLGLRFTFFGGIGGTYATTGYSPLTDFLYQTFHKLTHMHDLLVTFAAHYDFVADGHSALFDRTIKIGTALLIYALLSLWALRILPETMNHLRYAVHEKRWPIVGHTFLVTLWATIALAFHLALPLSQQRYATSLVLFTWPALVAEVERRRKSSIWLGLAAVCCVASLTLSSYVFLEYVEPVPNPSMADALRQAPTKTRQLYVLPFAGENNLPGPNPEYLRPVLGVSAEIVRVADIDWNCKSSSDSISFEHSMTIDVVHLTVTLPACAQFGFTYSQFDGTALVDGRLYRNETMSYELPEAYPIRPSKWWSRPPFYLGRRITVHVRPNGPARFIIQQGGPDGIASFDVP